MNPKHDIETFARQKMAEWGLIEKGWVFNWHSRRTQYGTCRVQRKRGESTFYRKGIFLSSFLIPTLCREEQEDVVLHEIAHAMDFETRGRSCHDNVWKAWAIRVGAKPERCKGSSDTEERRKSMKCKYTLRCPNGHEFHRHRFTLGTASCPICDPKAYNDKFRLEVTRNY